MINLRVAPLNLGRSSGAGTQLTPFPTGRIVSGDFPGNKLPGYFHPVPPGQKHASPFASHVSQTYLRRPVFICGLSRRSPDAAGEGGFVLPHFAPSWLCARFYSRFFACIRGSPLGEILFLMTRYERR
jgi:hypothetical protein